MPNIRDSILNENSGFIEAFENLFNRIIEMLGDEKLAEIADYEHLTG